MSKNVLQQETPKFGVQGRIKMCQGSVLAPVNAGLKLILVACGQNGEYSSPLYDMFVKRYSKIHADFRESYVMQQNKLGSVNTTALNSDVWVLRAMCIDPKNKLDKKALEDCVKKAIEMSKYEGGSLHISELLLQQAPALKKLLPSISDAGVNVYVYDEQS